MSIELAVVLLLLAVILALDVKASMLVLRDDLSAPMQRWMQLGLVWLLPMVGALIVLAVHRAPEKPSGSYRAEPDPNEESYASNEGSRGTRGRTHDIADGD